ncbi:5-hydroxyisourate hydrolase isoform X2 [Hippocampus zosterae]|uniref:5-hydroxyisourate hydrolase isoform X2 n=1 Tax=Hippocampus zosterae TaxID=109293 RepID=UPI00223D0F93|nr:5-hydroxyisourate hydrolase isoform X2 [Hippocampus zosterae]
MRRSLLLAQPVRCWRMKDNLRLYSSAHMSANRLQQLKSHIFPENKIRVMASPLTTHVLNTAKGVPVANIALSLHRLDHSTETWLLINAGHTNADGRFPGLITKQEFLCGVYKLRFETARYWESMGEPSFYPYAEIVFTISDPDQKYHIPLLLSQYSYSTYRGS